MDEYDEQGKPASSSPFSAFMAAFAPLNRASLFTTVNRVASQVFPAPHVVVQSSPCAPFIHLVSAGGESPTHHTDPAGVALPHAGQSLHVSAGAEVRPTAVFPRNFPVVHMASVHAVAAEV